MSRNRKLTKFQERVVIEEVRMGRWFQQKRIAARHGMSLKSLQHYIARARLEGLMWD